MHLEPLRTTLATTNKLLKRNKAFLRNQMSGLLALNLDANEHFKSRSRCCPQCLQRQITVKNSQGQEEEVTEYYHKEVYAQLSGPAWNTLLDVEPLRPGEEERAAALRLWGRRRRLYGVRFFDVVVADAWYAKEPFLKAVTALGWAVVVVLKQAELEGRGLKFTDGIKPAGGRGGVLFFQDLEGNLLHLVERPANSSFN
jgi:hypothetical protein